MNNKDEFYIDPYSIGGRLFRLLAINYGFRVPYGMIFDEIAPKPSASHLPRDIQRWLKEARKFLPPGYFILHHDGEAAEMRRFNG